MGGERKEGLAVRCLRNLRYLCRSASTAASRRTHSEFNSMCLSAPTWTVEYRFTSEYAAWSIIASVSPRLKARSVTRHELYDPGRNWTVNWPG